MLFALANPSLDDTTNALQKSPTETEWPQMKYVGHVLQRALMHVLGLAVEAGGAEGPWEEATALLKKHIEPDLFEATGGEFVSNTWEVFCRAMIDHSVIGDMEKVVLSTE